ncbi:phage tail assembly protein [Paraneptunicella aestuarii]|uniref:phage tail assembly protein n=1 Tax=Paraneptunicella aestuarii TaxID=2831148 RepID=UPI001E2A0424|nr:phage tail assembly protein [Paraneptunicella aestuarii]UAA38224.1 phage tail assembly protein [Paraneptunicella aestuarii]
MSNSIQLKFPVQAEGRTIESIEIRRPKARDLRKMETAKGGDIAKSIDLIANLAELPPSAIEDLDAADFQELSTMVAGFLDPK